MSDPRTDQLRLIRELARKGYDTNQIDTAVDEFRTANINFYNSDNDAQMSMSEDEFKNQDFLNDPEYAKWLKIKNDFESGETESDDFFNDPKYIEASNYIKDAKFKATGKKDRAGEYRKQLSLIEELKAKDPEKYQESKEYKDIINNQDYMTARLALNNITTARLADEGFADVDDKLKDFTGDKKFEKINLGQEDEDYILNNLSQKDLERYAAETPGYLYMKSKKKYDEGKWDMGDLWNVFGPSSIMGGGQPGIHNIPFLKKSNVKIGEQEADLSEMRMNSFLEQKGELDVIQNNIINSTKYTDEQKKEKLKVLNNKLEDLELSGFYNATDKLFKNNFEMTDDIKAYVDRNKKGGEAAVLHKRADDLAVLGQGITQLAGDATIGFVKDVGVFVADAFGARKSDEEGYGALDWLDDQYDKEWRSNWLGTSDASEYSLTGEDAKGSITDRMFRNTAEMLPFIGGIVASARKGDFRPVKSLVVGGKKFALTGRQLNAAKAAFLMTHSDNYYEAKEMGLTGVKAHAYSTMKSTGTAVANMIVPDANLLFGSGAYKAATINLVKNLKSAANREAFKGASKSFFGQIVGEQIEENLDVALGDVAKIATGLDLQQYGEFADWRRFQETTAATLMMTGMMGLGGFSANMKGNRKAYYDAFRQEGGKALSQIEEYRLAAQKKFDNAKSPQRKAEWAKLIKEFDDSYAYGQDVLKAVNANPDVVSGAQLDLLVEKNKLLRFKEGEQYKNNPLRAKKINDRLETINQAILDSDIIKAQEQTADLLTQNVESIAKDLNISFNKFGTTQEVEARIKEINKTITDPKNKINIKQSGDQGFIVQNPDGSQEIIINQQVAKKEKAVSVAQHELLHGALLNTVTKDKNAAQKLATGLGNELLKIDPRLLRKGGFLESRVNQYKNDPTNVKAEEMLTAFSDALTQGYIPYEAQNQGLFQKLGDVKRDILNSLGFKVKFNSGKDVFNFIRDFNKSVKVGKLGKGMVRTVQEGADIGGKLDQIPVTDEFGNTTTKSSRSVEQDLNNMGRPENFDADKVISDIYANGMLEGLIKSKIPIDKPPGFSQEDFISGAIAELIPHIRNFNPEINDSLSGWINSQLANKIGNVFKKGEAATKARFEQEIDQGARQVAETKTEREVDAKQPVRSKFRRQLGIDQKLVDKVKNAVVKTFGTKLPEIDNKNFVKELTKRYRVELKPAIAKLMGTRDNYKSFLNKNKDVILANIPTSTLVRFERTTKPEDRIFTKEVGRNLSPTEVDNAVEKGLLPKDVNRLSGPTLYQKITPTAKQFLDFYTGKDIAPSKRGTRKDALAEEIGVELAFDATMEVVQSPDVVAKREAVNELLGIQNKENDIAVISKQINRDPMVKFSKGSKGDVMKQALEGVGIDNAIEQANALENFVTGKMVDGVTKNVIENALIETIPEAEITGMAYKKAVLTNLPFLSKVKSLQTYWKGKPKILTKEGQAVVKDHVENYLFDMIDKGLLPRELVTLQMSKTGKTEGSFISQFFKFDNRGLGREFKDEFISRLKNAPSYKNLEDPSLKKYYTKFFKNKNNFEPANSKKLGNNEIGIINKIAQDGTRDQKIKRINNFMKVNTEGAIVKDAAQSFDLAINSSLQRWVDSMPDRNNAIEYVHRDKQANTNEVMSDRALAPFTSIYLIDGPQKFAIKGEHVVDSATVSALTVQSIYNGTFEQDFNSTRTGFEQSLGPKENFDNLDKILGKNSPIGDMRFMYDIPLAKNTFDFTTGKSKYDMMIENLAGKELANFKEIARVQDGAMTENRILSSKSNINEQVEQFRLIDKAVEVARNPNKVRKGISVFDFDDTLARTKSKVKAKMKDGSVLELDATEFAAKAEQIADQVAEFDFSDFNKVIGGTKGPLFELAQKRQGKFGNKDIFILTARPQASAPAIQTFLKGLGLDIPIKNITGLENGTPQAKADWVLQKAVDGYNDFYFADDAYKNVQAVQNVLNQIDVKSDVQQAIVKASKKLDKDFNDILEETKGVLSFKDFSDAAAKARGEQIGKYKYFLPPSAEDFQGLIYQFLGKGKKGEKQMEWFDKNLFKPFARATNDINNARQTLANDFKALRKLYPDVNKQLSKKTDYNDFTFDQAARVYLYNKAGFDIPGLSKTDLKSLLDIVNKDTKLKEFADKVGMSTKLEKGYLKPEADWIVGNMVSDMNNIVQRVGRKKYLKQWIDNKNVIFSKKNLNKIEAVYGTRFREALEDILYRMENGSNRSFGSNRLVNGFMNWTNNSIGAIMFFNSRSAILQTISSINYVNWSDNNPLKAGAAFANQGQYWSDFSKLFNSDFLKQRRSGLQSDIQEAEIANAVANSKNKVNAAISYLLKKGFLPTQMADSFAIASGGATFYRNRINKYKKEGLSDKEAEAKAFTDFREITEENQQSARPDRISMQQASPLGRLILAFQNTPMQYTRIMKRAMLDLANGRGDWKTNVSKIAYYGAIQNFMFNALQNALFGLMFGGEDEEDIEWDEKNARVANNMVDTILRGSGVYGAIASTLKNTVMRFMQEEESGRPDHAYTMIEALNLSPPIGSKTRKLYSATQTYKFNKDEIAENGFGLDNPAHLAIGNVVSATTNVPLDRVVRKLNNLKEAADTEHAAWQRIAMALGWSTWDVGVNPYEKKKSKFGRKNPFKNKKKNTMKRKNPFKK